MKLDRPLVGDRARSFDAIRGKGGHVDLRALQSEPAGVGLRDEQEIADESQEPPGVSLHGLEESALLGVELAGLLVEDEIEVAADGCQRRTKLVRDEGQELILQTVELQQPPVLVAQSAARGLGFHAARPAPSASDCSRREACWTSCLLRISTAAVTRRRIGTSAAQRTKIAIPRKPATG